MAESAPTTGVIIPLYTYPTDGTWQTVIKAKQQYPNVRIVAIINPNSGPGTSQDQNYVKGINNLTSAGVKVLGYVDTNYAKRSLRSVESDINAYKNWYGNINGIMFDEMSNIPGNETYYSTLNIYAKSLGFTMTVGNPGTTVPSSYIRTMDVLNIYEKKGLPSVSSLAGWVTGYSKTNFSVIAYGVRSLNASYVSSTTNYVSYLYITNAELPNPYNVLPSYFLAEVADLNAAI